MSDKIGRKLLMSFGLIGGVVAFFVVMFGVGFYGKFMFGSFDVIEFRVM